MNKKILVVENDSDILQMIGLVLSDEGYSPVLCKSDQGIFDVIRVERPEVILLDVVKPSDQGTVLCRALKTEETSKHIPVIVLSTHAKIESVKEICADDVIKKPFDIDYLLTVIREQLAGNALADSVSN